MTRRTTLDLSCVAAGSSGVEEVEGAEADAASEARVGMDICDRDSLDIVTVGE